MAAFNAPVQEKTTIDDGNNNIDITTTVKDGAVTLPLLYANASVSGFAGLGEDSTHLLKTNSSTGTSGAYVYLSLNLSTEDMFVATYINGDDSESYVFEIESITEGSSAKNATTLDNLASGGSNIEFSEVGDTKDRGSFTFLLDAASADDEWARVGVKASSGTVYLDRLVTKEGLQMRLPVVVNVTTATDGQFNMNASVLANPTTWAMNFTEEDENGNVALLTESFTVTLGLDNGDGTEPTATAFSTASTSYEEERNSDWGVGMQTSALATKVRYYNPSNGLGSVEILYAGEESYADVYVSEAGTTVAGSASIKVVKDSEVDSVQDKNLIVVGGSCINSVAAKMLGSDTPLCGDAWATKTNAGVGKYLIKVAASPYNAQKIAVLVAGYDAADTTKAAEKVATEGVEATVGETVYPLASA
jgi:hypothetical protein